jgi:hypothetical protein
MVNFKLDMLLEKVWNILFRVYKMYVLLAHYLYSNLSWSWDTLDLLPQKKHHTRNATPVTEKYLYSTDFSKFSVKRRWLSHNKSKDILNHKNIELGLYYKKCKQINMNVKMQNLVSESSFYIKLVNCNVCLVTQKCNTSNYS